MGKTTGKKPFAKTSTKTKGKGKVKGKGKGKGKKPLMRGLIDVKSQNSYLPKGDFRRIADKNPFPPSMVVKFCYSGRNQLSTGNNVSAFGTQYDFRLNSPYDPYTGITSEFNYGCAGWSQLLSATGPYTRYKVRAIYLNVCFYDPDGANSDSTICAVVINEPGITTTVTGSSISDMESSPNCRLVKVCNSGNQRAYIKQYFPMETLFAWSKTQYNANKEDTTGPYNNSPATIPLMSIACANERGVAATTVLCHVNISFVTELYERSVALAPLY